MLGGALYYMIGSTAAISAFFLIAEPVSRGDQGSDAPQTTDDEADPMTEGWAPMGLDTVEDVETPASTRTVSWLTMAICFGLVAAMLAGLPPLPGFIGKFAILRGAVEDNLTMAGTLPVILWVYAAMLILSGLGALIALMRFGIRRFWAEEGPTPRILALEVVPVVLLLAMIALQTLRADALLSYTRATAVALLEPATYRDAVLKNAQDVRAAPAVNLAPEPPATIEADP